MQCFANANTSKTYKRTNNLKQDNLKQDINNIHRYKQIIQIEAL